MRARKIHITGASGSGATTLGRALATRCAFAHFDTDDFYWMPTDPPYRVRRAIPERLRLMEELFLGRADWVLSGSLDGWGDPLVAHFDLVVFLFAPVAVRLRRLRARESRHFGAAAVRRGGWHHLETEGFLEWAAHYDDATRSGRSLARHEAWLAKLPCPILRLDGTRPVRHLAESVWRAASEAPPARPRRTSATS